MAQASVGWRTQTGQWLTDPAFRPEICVSAWTDLDPAGENGIDRVEFVVDDGSGPETVTVTDRTLRFPNYAKTKTPLAQRRTGSLTPFRGFGFKLDPTQYGPTIAITATVYSRAGTATPVPRTIRFYNDTDGTDRRPSKKQIFFGPAGNNANPGTESQPVLDVQTAIGLARANPAGTALADRDCGGAEVVGLPGTTVWRSFGGAPAFHTSGDRWLTITGRPGCKLVRSSVDADGHFGGGGIGAGTSARFWISAEIEGLGLVFANDAAVVSEIQLDGAYYHSSHWSKARRWSLRFFEENGGHIVAFTNPGPNARIYCTASLIRGRVGGLSRMQLAHDCVITDYLGIAIETFDDGSGGNQVCNCIVQDQRAYVDVMGRFRGPVGVGAVVTVPQAGQMRIDAVAPTFFGSEGAFDPVSLATLAEIAGRPFWRVALSGGFPAGGTGLYQVLSAGTNASGFGYVVVANPNATPGVCTGTAVLETAFTSGTTDLVHPDIVFFSEAGPVGQTNVIIEGLVMRGIYSSQGLFIPSANMRRLALVGIRDGCRVPLHHNMSGGSKTDALILGCTLNGTTTWGGAQSGCRYYDNVFGTLPSGISGGKASHNHVINGGTVPGDANGTTGAWFAYDPQADPYWYTPLASRFDTASGLLPQPVESRHLGSNGNTRGVDRFAALFDWSVSGSDVPEIAGNVDFPFTVDGTLSPIATVSGNVDFFFGVDGPLVPGSLLGGNVDFAVAVDGILTSFSLLSGNVDFAVTVDGALQSGSTVAGNVDFPMTVDGTLVPGSLLAGNVDFAFSVDGGITQLDGEPPVLFSADVDFPFAIDGTLLAGANLAGNVDFGVTVDGQLQAGATVGGNVDFRLTNDGQIDRLPFFTGNVDFLVTVDGTLESANSIDNYFAPRQAPGELRRWPLHPPTFWE